MPLGCLRKALGIHPQTAQVVTLLLASLTIPLAPRFTHSQTHQARPSNLLFHIIGRIDMPILARFNAPVLAVYRFVSADLIAEGPLLDDGREEAFDFIVEGALIAF